MAIRIIKKLDTKSVPIKSTSPKKALREVVQNWVSENQMRKSEERENALKFWGLK